MLHVYIPAVIQLLNIRIPYHLTIVLTMSFLPFWREKTMNLEFNIYIMHGVYLRKQSINIRKDIIYGSSKDWYLFAFCPIDQFHYVLCLMIIVIGFCNLAAFLALHTSKLFRYLFLLLRGIKLGPPRHLSDFQRHSWITAIHQGNEW